MNADRVINKINHDMNAFNESGGREDKACAEGLRRARTYIQQEVLKRKILTHDQQVVLEWLKWSVEDQKNSPMDAVYLLILGEALTSVSLAYIALTNKEEAQVLRIFSAWTLEQEEE